MVAVYQILNICKATSAGLILVFASVYGLSDLRKALYTGLHLSYLIWWFLHQWAVPGWAETVFGTKVERPENMALMVSIFGVLYALPGWLAFTNPHSMSPITAVVALILCFNGSCLNVGSDFYKTAQKQAGVKKVCTHVYDGRLGPIPPNHLGDWLRYASFALASGTVTGWIVPAIVIGVNCLTYLERGQKK
ncbi:hypothetical protein WJX84_002142 [Apatococcus fuscideae]|uniref:Steroid 5-alpha reductase C-terminal domain-containing protein n=1 Tax=Apatococcus fuscideae TaxID=2026836 RepID=A0AAW1SRC9_9CHLO